MLTHSSPTSLDTGPGDAPPPIRRRPARPEPTWGNRKRRHAVGETVLYRKLSTGTVMRATVDSYEQATDSYFVAVDGSGGGLRKVLADQLAPIPASDPVVRSDLPELGVFTAPAPRDRGGARDAAAAILLGAGFGGLGFRV